MTDKNTTYHLKFWGTRGSLPVNSPAHIKYGGNSSCVEVRLDGSVIIIDGGSGMRLLGENLVRQGCKNIHIFMSHFHNDHICGIPFFAPLFDKETSVTFHTIAEDNPDGFEKILKIYMSEPTYPVGTEVFNAKVSYEIHPSGSVIPLTGVRVTSHPIPHPGGCHAYRLSDGARDIVYATDTEHTPDKINQSLVAFIQNADVLIYDCTYEDENFGSFIGYGHSTWQEGVRLCQAGNVSKLAIFHHAPEHNDRMLDSIGRKAQELFSGAVVTADFQTMWIEH